MAANMKQQTGGPCEGTPAVGVAPRRMLLNGRTFKVLQFTDLHFLVDAEDAKTLEVMRKMIALEDPDLVVMTGDTVSGTSIPSTPAGVQRFEEEWAKAVSPMQAAGKPWAMVLGNHCPDGPCTKEQILAIDQKCGGLARSEVVTELGGVTNYVIELARAGSSQLPDVALFFFDGITNPDKTGDDYTAPEVIQWFTETASKMDAGRAQPVPKFMFLHVPVPQFAQVWEQEPCLGLKEERVCCPPRDTGLYAAAAAAGGVKAIVAGHDHANDYSGALSAHPDLQLVYGRKSGYGYYNTLPHGARVFELAMAGETFAWKSWIRDETGEVVQQHLHLPTAPIQRQLD